MFFYPTTHTATKHTFSNKILSPLSIPSLPPPQKKTATLGESLNGVIFQSTLFKRKFSVKKCL